MTVSETKKRPYFIWNADLSEEECPEPFLQAVTDFLDTLP